MQHVIKCLRLQFGENRRRNIFYNIGIKQENLKHNKISYRPLRKNISIWSKDRCIEKVGFKIVFDKMLEVINGGVNLSEDVLDYDNHSNCFIME